MRIHILHNALVVSATAYYCSMLSATTNAFQTPIGPTFGIPQQKQTQINVFTHKTAPTSTSLCASSKEDEIAALEEQLQRLKEEASKEEEDGEELVEESSTSSAAGVIDRKSMNDELMPEMLTEQWKESNSAAGEEDSESGGLMQTVTSLVGGLALLAGVLAFSQVPVGQEDFNKYSAGKAGGSKIDLGDINTVRPSDF
mmetsp:Transcript_18583/g.25783  ORF Transcript_18583/g.25783 Transcript_18583/m.25783 type:complete len:199 (-) Transcript_18583:143-739(-)